MAHSGGYGTISLVFASRATALREANARTHLVSWAPGGRHQLRGRLLGSPSEVLNPQRAVECGEANRRRTTGDHPSARAEIREGIAASQRQRWEERRDSGEESGFGPSPTAFARLVLPRIQGVSSSQLATATRLSPGYCALVRNGKRVPHARHWAAFQLAGLQGQAPVNR